jgi:mannose-6-phosphate isomerase-like protein (cupin superfamily)
MKEARVASLDFDTVVGPGSRFNDVLFGDETSSDFLVAFKRLPEGTPAGSYHVHKRSENVLIVLKGTLEALVGDQRYLVNEGQVIYMPAAVPHATGNGGPGECQSVEIYAPSRGEGDDMDSYPAELPAKFHDAVGTTAR